MRIRKYKPLDREAVEKIHFETGFMGNSMNVFLSNNKLWKKMISYYVEKEPESAFVLEDKGKVVGYLLGCVDDKKQKNTVSQNIKFILNIIKGNFLSKKDRVFWRSQLAYLKDILRGKSGELKIKKPENAGHFHINLLPEARGKSYGSKMLKKFEALAKSKSAKYIHAESFRREISCTNSFWSKNNFKDYDKVISLHWKKQLPKEKIYLVCNYKKI